MSLTPEILKYIFDLVCCMTASQHIRIASVCKKFRKAALEHPKLWTYVSNQQSRGMQELQLARSRKLPLHVYFGLDKKQGTQPTSSKQQEVDKKGHLIETLVAVKKHSKRWVVFTFNVERDQKDEDEHKQITAVLKSITAPRCNSCPYSPACATWTAPSLSHLRCEVGFFLGPKAPVPACRLRELEVAFKDCEKNIVPACVASLWRFLRSASAANLQRLSVTSANMKTGNTNASAQMKIGKVQPSLVVKLLHLRSLGMDVSKDSFDGWRITTGILNSIEVANVESIRAAFDFGEKSDRSYDTWTSWMCQQNHQKLMEVQVTLVGHEEDEQSSIAQKLRRSLDEHWSAQRTQIAQAAQRNAPTKGRREVDVTPDLSRQLVATSTPSKPADIPKIAFTWYPREESEDGEKNEENFYDALEMDAFIRGRPCHACGRRRPSYFDELSDDDLGYGSNDRF